MNIWLINHYAVPTKHYPLARPATFAKYLMRAGHTVTIFAASSVHNSSVNLITDGQLYREDYVDGIHYVYVKDISYQGNGLKRIINMILFPLRLPRVCRRFQKPDAILAVSATPMACMRGLHLAKKYRCKGICEIADLWPESFIAYGLMGRYHPLLKLMYAYEKRIYIRADAIIFTMEGGKDYIIEKGWDIAHGGLIDLRKVYHINNGIDLEIFRFNKEQYQIEDEDLSNPELFKVIYTGSIRQVNNVEKILDVAKKINDRSIKFLIWGGGDQLDNLKRQVTEEKISNVVFKGQVNKVYIPFILSKAHLNIATGDTIPLYKYGISPNKLFEYFASEKPCLCTVKPNYSLIEKYNAGIETEGDNVEDIVRSIIYFKELSKEEYSNYCSNAQRAASDYDFKKLTNLLLEVISNSLTKR